MTHTPTPHKPGNPFIVAGIYGLVALILGAGVGFFSAHHFPLWGGDDFGDIPYSQARFQLVPGHVVFFGSIFGALAFVLSLFIRAKRTAFQQACGLGIMGAAVGAVLGYFSAHYFPLWEGFLTAIARPHSPARASLVPGHMLALGVLFGVSAFALTYLARKSRS
jgi:hypothetical protein